MCERRGRSGEEKRVRCDEEKRGNEGQHDHAISGENGVRI